MGADLMRLGKLNGTPAISQIAPRLFLSGWRGARKGTEMLQLGIKAVVNTAAKDVQGNSPAHLRYLNVHISDKKQKDGKFHYVDMQFAVYYKLITDAGQTGPVNNVLKAGDVEAFPPGFKMLAGSPFQKEPLHYINHKCYGPNSDTPGFPSNPELCTGGIRATF